MPKGRAGRHESPWRLGGLSSWELTRRVWRELSEDEVTRVRTDALATGKGEFVLEATLTDAQGEVVAGSLSDAVQTRDLWTFRRDVASRDPNWQLIETDEDE